jgi:transcriptional regulator with XRE-family HTH domain
MEKLNADDLIAARKAAGLTQLDGALAGYAHVQRWQELECGKRAIEPWRAEYFLHRAGILKMPFAKSK